MALVDTQRGCSGLFRLAAHADRGIRERKFTLSFSSEEPYERWFGVEILDHGPGAVDLARLNEIGCLLFNHNRDVRPRRDRPISFVQGLHLLNPRRVPLWRSLKLRRCHQSACQCTYSSARQGLIEDGMTYAEEDELLAEILDEIYDFFCPRITPPKSTPCSSLA